jgi:predicted PurR-regulated permease PerM
VPVRQPAEGLIVAGDNRFRNLVLGVALAIMIGWVLYIGRAILIPVIASVIVAYILVTLARRMAQVPVIGPVAPAWSRYLVSVAIVLFILLQLIALIASNVERVVAQAPVYQQTLLAFIGDLAVRFGVEAEPTWESLWNQVLGQINLQSLIGTTVASVSSLVGNVFVVLVYAGFLLAERSQFERKLRMLSSDKADTRRILAIISAINTKVGDYLALKTLVNLILGVISWSIMALIGIDLAAFWAVLIALFNYIPYVGSFIAVVFPVALTIVQFGDFGIIFMALIGLTAAQMFIGNFLEPRLMGKSLNLSPFVILVALTIWYALWGVAGALLAVPITAIVMIIFAQFEATRPIAILLSSEGQISELEGHGVGNDGLD